MNTVSEDQRNMVVKSLESTLHKLKRSLESMKEQGSSTTLVRKRLLAIQVGLASLENDWFTQDFMFDEATIEASLETLKRIASAVERQTTSAHRHSSQKTLIDRRRKALELAIQSLNKRLDRHV
jgi:predicted RNase H-like nuclease (RuvC/YqgF family)